MNMKEVLIVHGAVVENEQNANQERELLLPGI